MSIASVSSASTPRHVSLVALPDAVVSTIAGIFDVMNAVSLIGLVRTGATAPFQVQIVGEAAEPLTLASGVPIEVQRAVATIDRSEIVIVPSVLLHAQGWRKGRYPRLRAHSSG